MPPADVNIEVMELLKQLLHKSGEKSSRSRVVYKTNLDRRVKHT